MRAALFWLFWATIAGAQVAEYQAPPPPPTPPPILHQSPVAPKEKMATAQSASPPPAPVYSIGSPTDEEQYYQELINRARANPTAEGLLLATTTDSDVTSAYTSFGVNLTL